MDGLKERIRGIEEELGKSAGLDPLFDRYRSGSLRAYHDMLNITVEETQTNDD